jgi:hypothetical protein
MSGQYTAAEVAARIPTATATRDGKVAITIHLDPAVASHVVKACDIVNAHPIAAIEAHVGVWFAEAVSIPKPWREVMTEQRAEIAALRRQVDAMTRAGIRGGK